MSASPFGPPCTPTSTPHGRLWQSPGRHLANFIVCLHLRILYDLTELENASRFKKGDTERTPKKIANVDKWFGKLDTDIGTFLTYFA